jgi:hypothetical protein
MHDLIVFTDQTSKSVVLSLKFIPRLNCSTTAWPPPVVEDYFHYTVLDFVFLIIMKITI